MQVIGHLISPVPVLSVSVFSDLYYLYGVLSFWCLFHPDSPLSGPSSRPPTPRGHAPHPHPFSHLGKDPSNMNYLSLEPSSSPLLSQHLHWPRLDSLVICSIHQSCLPLCWAQASPGKFLTLQTSGNWERRPRRRELHEQKRGSLEM